MTYELVIIGAGISGLAAAEIAHEAGLKEVLLVDYGKTKGGMTRPLFDSGLFEQERQLLERTVSLPYEIKYQSTVTGFFPGEDGENHQLNLQTSNGAELIETSKVMICSGSLEKPREGNWIAGSRPAGVMTASMALGLAARGYVPGQKLLILENGRIMAATARRLESVSQVVRLSGEQWEVTRISGIARLNQVELRERATGNRQTVDCDTLIYAHRRIPSTFFLKGSAVERDEHHAISVDETGKTNIDNVYAAGTCTNQGDDDHLQSIALAQRATRALLNRKG
jgi:thioredoxin reductase